VRVAQFRAALQQLREQARPGAHAYLDAIGVLARHRGGGIATQLLSAGHAWADAAGLQCYLDTCSDANIALYRGRGYEVVTSIPLADSGVRITAMRRPIGGPDG
jgi:GNAT superfamily N-acetyltransferase